MLCSSVRLLLSLCFLQTGFRCGRAQTTSAAPDAPPSCGGRLRPGQRDFVLDAEEAVKDGATFLSSPAVSAPQGCARACCREPGCNLALVELGGPGGPEGEEGVRTCFLFNCVHRNRFVCRFVNKAGFVNFILDSVFEKHLAGPEGAAGEAPPLANAGRDVLVQPGDPVTLNGIESQALGDAHITDFHWSLLSGDAAVEMEKTDLPDQLRLSNLQPGVYVFQLKVTDSNDQSAAAKVTVRVLDPQQSGLHCLVPMKVGPCRGAFPRWYFSAASGSCEQFVFGGCKPNHNNFLSQKECSATCSGVTAASERSVALPNAEVCVSPCQPSQFSCSSGCCLDKTLECDEVQQCSDGSDESRCSAVNQTFNRLLDIDVNQKRARCTEPPRTGPCRASHTRWFYDPLNRKCHRFTFGGCDGNDNNFQEEESCSKTCAGVTEHHVFARGIFERFEEGESESGSIAVAVILAVAILALLAVLSYCFLKSRKDRSRRAVAAGPAHAAMTEERDTLVYNSTTKPV